MAALSLAIGIFVTLPRYFIPDPIGPLKLIKLRCCLRVLKQTDVCIVGFLPSESNFSFCSFISSRAEEPHRILQRRRHSQHDDNIRVDALRKADHLHVEETETTQRLCTVRQRRHLPHDMAAHLHPGAADGPNRLSLGADALPHWRT
jgi:hypothetical protein